MEKLETEVAAINALGIGLYGSLALIAVWMLVLPRMGKKGRLQTIGEWTLLIGLVAVFAWTTFNPALNAMKILNSPLMFSITGFLAGTVLFLMRSASKEIYGLLEILIAFLTWMALGSLFSTESVLTTLIGFVGAVYVFVRGLTNIVEGSKERQTLAGQ